MATDLLPTVIAGLVILLGAWLFVAESERRERRLRKLALARRSAALDRRAEAQSRAMHPAGRGRVLG